MDKSLTIQVIMPEETKNKVSIYETPNNAIAYASDIP